MTAVAFDTLKYAETLEASGVPSAQATAQARALAEAMETNLATKQDLKDMGATLNQDMLAIKQDLQNVRNDLKLEITELRAEFKTAILSTENKLIMWMVTLLIGQTGLIYWIINRLIH